MPSACARVTSASGEVLPSSSEKYECACSSTHPAVSVIQPPQPPALRQDVEKNLAQQPGARNQPEALAADLAVVAPPVGVDLPLLLDLRHRVRAVVPDEDARQTASSSTVTVIGSPSGQMRVMARARSSASGVRRPDAPGRPPSACQNAPACRSASAPASRAKGAVCFPSANPSSPNSVHTCGASSAISSNAMRRPTSSAGHGCDVKRARRARRSTSAGVQVGLREDMRLRLRAAVDKTQIESAAGCSPPAARRARPAAAATRAWPPPRPAARRAGCVEVEHQRLRRRRSQRAHRAASRPCAHRCASLPAAPKRAATEAAGSRAKSASVRKPSQSQLLQSLGRQRQQRERLRCEKARFVGAVDQAHAAGLHAGGGGARGELAAIDAECRGECDAEFAPDLRAEIGADRAGVFRRGGHSC